MDTAVINKPEYKQIEKEANALQVKSEKIVIVDDLSRQEAAEHLKTCSAYMDRMEPIVDHPRKVAYSAYEEIRRWKDDLISRIKGPKTTISKKIGEWDLKIEEKRLREASIAEAKAREEAEKNRQAEIRAARKAKDAEAVQALKRAPVVVAPVVPKTAAPTRVEGVSTRFEWKLESIFNPSAVPCEFHEISERKIKERIKSLGGAHGIPGVKAVRVPIVSGRG